MTSQSSIGGPLGFGTSFYCLLISIFVTAYSLLSTPVMCNYHTTTFATSASRPPTPVVNNQPQHSLYTSPPHQHFHTYTSCDDETTVTPCTQRPTPRTHVNPQTCVYDNLHSLHNINLLPPRVKPTEYNRKIVNKWLALYLIITTVYLALKRTYSRATLLLLLVILLFPTAYAGKTRCTFIHTTPTLHHSLPLTGPIAADATNKTTVLQPLPFISTHTIYTLLFTIYDTTTRITVTLLNSLLPLLPLRTTYSTTHHFPTKKKICGYILILTLFLSPPASAARLPKGLRSHMSEDIAAIIIVNFFYRILSRTLSRRRKTSTPPAPASVSPQLTLGEDSCNARNSSPWWNLPLRHVQPSTS